jgi:hypothetical protein
MDASNPAGQLPLLDPENAPASPIVLASGFRLTASRHRMPDPQTHRSDSGVSARTDGDPYTNKHAALPSYLSEQMTVSALIQELEGLHVNKRHEQARFVIDTGVQAFLLAATKAAAADHFDSKVRHVWRSIKEPPR